MGPEACVVSMNDRMLLHKLEEESIGRSRGRLLSCSLSFVRKRVFVFDWWVWWLFGGPGPCEKNERDFDDILHSRVRSGLGLESGPYLGQRHRVAITEHGDGWLRFQASTFGLVVDEVDH